MIWEILVKVTNQIVLKFDRKWEKNISNYYLQETRELFFGIYQELLSVTDIFRGRRISFPSSGLFIKVSPLPAVLPHFNVDDDMIFMEYQKHRVIWDGRYLQRSRSPTFCSKQGQLGWGCWEPLLLICACLWEWRLQGFSGQRFVLAASCPVTMQLQEE